MESSKIIGIQFGLMSPEQILKSSVAEITSKETYMNNIPVINGIFDPRMGVLDPGFICPTDGLNYINSPGYFGHIKLARPVYYIQYLSNIVKCLRCICLKCSKLLCNKSKYKYLMKLNSKERWSYIFESASKVTRCGDNIEDGCGYKKPTKIKKEGFSTIIIEYLGNNGEKTIKKLSPEIVIKIFERITDDDVNMMGFNSTFSRPEWMICKYLAVPPPSVRPSVKHDAQQRSEDDLTNIIISIIKSNQLLKEKIENKDQPTDASIIEDMTSFLQYNVATLVNNKLPGMDSVAQRSSGRILKSITDRLNGKSGRIRGNLMGKRVDYSARSVITGDPNLGIAQLGVPKKVAMNITYPVIVNQYNKVYLKKLVENGPDVYPGAKILQRKTGQQISLRYINKDNLQLNIGDIVHRHMIDGDNVLFNRQPTLHRMSMMCHVAKIMNIGNTFRMNVADTKPYNADFDGDEMNMHMPQNSESKCELKYLAAVPHQIISPASNSPIVGIFQDSLLGLYQFTRPNDNIIFSQRDIMNLLMTTPYINSSLLNKNTYTNKDIISQILPTLSLSFKNGQYNDDDNNNNNIVNIVNGFLVSGQIDKNIKYIIHSIFNDHGHKKCEEFIDSLQFIVTEYMKTSSFSVGISDLVFHKDAITNINKIKNEIEQHKNKVMDLFNQSLLGSFHNNTSENNNYAIESKIIDLLNEAREKSGKEGRTLIKNQNKEVNRFVTMINAGSKGSNINIAQMISCLGQQEIDGKRIPYGFQDRTLPHYTKFDDSPEARGFVQSSFIEGLTPQELFFHAMGGRVGLIDTAVKTSQTGYIQRRLIKGMEDMKINYDMSVRDSNNRIIQFKYGDDGFDTTKIEGHRVPFIFMSLDQIYSHFHIPQNNGLHSQLFSDNITYKSVQSNFKKKIDPIIKNVINTRDLIMSNIFNYENNDKIYIPINFSRIINNIKNKTINTYYNDNNNSENNNSEYINMNINIDIDPNECLEMIQNTKNQLESIMNVSQYLKTNSNNNQPTNNSEQTNTIFSNNLLFTMIDYFLTPNYILYKLHFNRFSFKLLLDTIILYFKKSIIQPGEMVGMIAAQSIGEPTTQMSEPYNAFKKIVVVNKNKSIIHKTIKIGELCDSFIEKYPEYTFPTGHENSVETLLDKLDEEYYIIGVDKYEKTSWNRISHFSRHPVNGNLMTVKTRSGRKVTTTLSHSHLIRREQQVKSIRGSDLNVGMRIPVCKHIDNTFVDDKVKIGDVEYTLDNLFGWFIGTYLSNGSCSDSTICITNNSQYFIQNMFNVATLFGCELVVENTPGQYDTTTKTKFEHKELSKFLLEHCGSNSFTKKVPDFIFTSPLECKSGVIQGYIDSDGIIICDKNHHEIRGCSRSELLIKDICLLFSYFDIFTNVLESIYQEKPLYHFVITSGYAQLYRKHIGTIKTEQLDELCKFVNHDDVHNLSNDIDKIEGLNDIIATCVKILQLYNNQTINSDIWKNNSSINRITLQKYINIFKEVIQEKNIISLDTEMNILEQAVNSNIIWDEIIDIKIYTPPKDEYVYDFTVPKDQTFMGDTGIIVHNTLNTFHFAGVSSKSNVTRGVPRIEEILSISKEPSSISATVYLKEYEQNNIKKAQQIQYILENTTLKDIVSNVSICYDPNGYDSTTNIEEDFKMLELFYDFENRYNHILNQSISDELEKDKTVTLPINNSNISPWIIRIELDKEKMLDKNINMDEIHFAIENKYNKPNEINCVFSDYNDEQLIIRINFNNILSNDKFNNLNSNVKHLDETDQIYLLKNIQDNLLENTILKGIRNIKNVQMRKLKTNIIKKHGKFINEDSWVLDTNGSNLIELLSLDIIDQKRTYSNNIVEIYRVLGIEATREIIYREIMEVLEFDGSYINSHHVGLLCDRMCISHKLVSIYRHGINNDNIGPIAKASFEETTEMFLKAARHAELDNMRGVSANIMCGQQGNYGTSSFKVYIDTDELVKQNKFGTLDNYTKDHNMNNLDNIHETFKLQSKSQHISNDTPSNEINCSLDNIENKFNHENITSTIIDNNALDKDINNFNDSLF